ncbi:hypothetical protein ACTHGU_14450 [Chitinophagaceae bacterium MMS25-I14]
MKPTRLLIALCLLLLANIITQAKDDNKPVLKEIQIEGGDFNNVNSFFVSEIHGFSELNSFKVSLIGYLQQTSHIKHVILEMGHSTAYLINRYLQKGDDNCIANPKAKYLYEELRKLYEQHPFTVHGIDFERMEFVKATKYILSDNAGAEKSELYTYISSITDTADRIPGNATGYEARTYFYNNAQTIFSREKEKLRAVVKTDFDILERIFQNPASEQQMRKRNKSMYTNISELKPEMQEGFVCILGGSHNMLGSNQSLLSKYLSNNPGNIVLIKMLCRNCYTASYFTATALTPFAHDPDDTRSQTEELAASFDDHYTKDGYRLVNEKNMLKDDAKNNKQVSIYYALFKDQPQ